MVDVFPVPGGPGDGVRYGVEYGNRLRTSCQDERLCVPNHGDGRLPLRLVKRVEGRRGLGGRFCGCTFRFLRSRLDAFGEPYYAHEQRFVHLYLSLKHEEQMLVSTELRVSKFFSPYTLTLSTLPFRFPLYI